MLATVLLSYQPPVVHHAFFSSYHFTSSPTILIFFLSSSLLLWYPSYSIRACAILAIKVFRSLTHMQTWTERLRLNVVDTTIVVYEWILIHAFSPPFWWLFSRLHGPRHFFLHLFYREPLEISCWGFLQARCSLCYLDNSVQCILCSLKHYKFCHCFDTVGWASGRAPSL